MLLASVSWDNADFSDGCEQLEVARVSRVPEDAVRTHLVSGLHRDVGRALRVEQRTSAGSAGRESNGNRHKCTFCGKNFARQYSLTRHRRLHTGDRPFQCHLCPMAFVGRYALGDHLRTHTGERPYQCHVCQMAFAKNTTLNTHLRVHKPDRPYQCHLCPRAFKHKVTLDDHLRIHTGDKPYKCHMCSRMYSWRRSLVNHLLTSHQLAPSDGT
ncbi:hypothetical protein HPB50_007544 [Hyalomma asiaticum]|uniref:Uncharacterized protein n=1 Tax=Hyalomma asiaticum TaxID=266040 RepID=A0ACB7RM93_HYAAI|nr:hypothetical protein HPB50_007544 [Hyalomma asiaticum]